MFSKKARYLKLIKDIFEICLSLTFRYCFMKFIKHNNNSLLHYFASSVNVNRAFN